MSGPIPMLQGLGDEIGPALASLTDTIGTLLNPTAKYDQALKSAFLQKPELMQKFVDVEKANPGTLKAFGFGEGATNFVSGMMESIDALKNRVIQPDVAKALSSPGSVARRTLAAKESTGMTPGELTADRLHEWLNSGGLDLLKKDPEAFDRGIRELLKLPSKLEQRLESSTLHALDESVPLKDKTPNEIKSMILAGKLGVKELSGGLLDPQTAGATKFALQMWQQEQNAELRKELQRTGRSEHNMSIQRAKLAAAIQQRAASGYIGTIEAHYKSIWGENYGDSEPSPEEMKAVEQFQTDANVGVRVKQQQAVMKAITPLIEQITPSVRKKGAKIIDEGRARLVIQQINKHLTEAGIPWQARYDTERHFFSANRPKIVYTNKEGMVTEDPSALVSDIPPAGTIARKSVPATVGSDVRRTIVWINTLPAEQQDSVIQRLYDLEKESGGDGSRTDSIVDEIEAQ